MVLPMHGGDLYGYRQPPLDFSANVSPLGLPGAVRELLARSTEQFSCYPDPHCRRLREAIAAKDGVAPAQILCGNGAAELLYRIAFALAPKTALIPSPAFAEYERALTAAGCACNRFPLREEDDFRVTDALLDAIKPGLSVLVLCNPNNPTGQPIEPALLLRLIERCGETGTILLLDECFLPFLEERGMYAFAQKLEQYPHLLLLRAFTKFYAMAGLRLGYLLSGNAPLLQRIADCGPPWSVSTPAQLAGVAALADEEYPEELRACIRTERAWMQAECVRMGLRVIGSRANFLFFHSARGNLYERLLARGILIRSCANFPGLEEHYSRVAVRLRPENARLIAALDELLKEAD